MNDDLKDTVPDTDHDGTDNPSEARPQPLSPSFLIALALVGFLTLLIIFVNIPGIRESAGVSITLTPWTLHSYGNTTGNLVPVKSGTEITAVFDRNGTITGFSGCNQYHANYTVRNLAITITPPASTKMFCGEAGIMEQEINYLNDLQKAVELRTSESDLILYDRSGKPVLVFVKR